MRARWRRECGGGGGRRSGCRRGGGHGGRDDGRRRGKQDVAMISIDLYVDLSFHDEVVVVGKEGILSDWQFGI